jgi:hypothetical protein
MNLGACGALPRFPERAVWFRAIQPQFWPTALETVHTTTSPTRFNPGTPADPSFPVLYLSETHVVALLEVDGLLGSTYSGGFLLSNPYATWTVLNVQVLLHEIVDLTDVAAQDILETTAQELTGDWEAYYNRGPTSSIKLPSGPAPTQLLGKAIHSLIGVEGMRVPSAKDATHMNLVIFADKLRPGSSVVFHYEGTGQRWTITPKKSRPKRAKP